MSYAQLTVVRSRLAVGRPLPFNVRDTDHRVLLAQGQVIATQAELDTLLRSGALVDMRELMTPAQRIARAPHEALPALWQRSLSELALVLSGNPDAHFIAALNAATVPAMALIERDPELALQQVLQVGDPPLARYGLDHALDTAIASVLVARRLGWSETDAQRAFKAALTMNLSMLELQGQLATQAEAPSPEQRDAVHAHPWFSTRLLELAGVTDPDWLDAVATHHEALDGAGYPASQRLPTELAALIRRADIYLAKRSARLGRPAMSSEQAAQAMRALDPKHEMTATLVDAFGERPA
jgi:hypothetical protein